MHLPNTIQDERAATEETFWQQLHYVRAFARRCEGMMAGRELGLSEAHTRDKKHAYTSRVWHPYR